MKFACVAFAVCLLFVPTMTVAFGEREVAHEAEKAIGKHIEHEAMKALEAHAPAIKKAVEAVAEHSEKVAATPAAGATAKSVAPHAGIHAAATSHLLSSIIVGVAVAAPFLLMLAYDLTHPGPPAFAGQSWDTCANTTVNTPDPRCRPFLSGRSY